MNDNEDIQIEQPDLVELMELPFEDTLEVAGGPQITNDWPA